MILAESIFFWCAVWFYGIAFLSHLYGLVFTREKWVSAGWYFIVAGFAAHTVSICVRWSLTGHFPVQGTYENSVMGAWFIALLFIAIRLWQKQLDIIGLAVMPVTAMMLGHGIMENSELVPLSPPYKSNWLWFHVFFAWVAYGAFCVAAGMGALYLVKEKKGNAGLLNKLPEIDVLSESTLKVIMFGFVALTVEVGAGAIWAHGLWGRYWGWDPIEIWSLITWLIYGIYIHLGVTLGWRGARMAWMAVIALASVFVTFGGIGYLGGIHTPIMVE